MRRFALCFVAALLCFSDWTSSVGAPVAAQSAGTWQTLAPSTIRRHEISYVHYNGKFYLTGDRGFLLHEVYDAATNTWGTAAPLPSEAHHAQAVELNGLIYYLGGLVGPFPDHVTNAVRIFNPAANTWSTGTPMPALRARGGGGTALHNGKLYVAGGLQDDASVGTGHAGVSVNLFDMYDPVGGTWTALPGMPRARDHFHAVVVGNKFYAVGGRLGGAAGSFNAVIPQIDVYDFTSGTWSTLPAASNHPTPRAGSGTAVIGDEIIVIGGEGNGQAYDDVNAFSTTSGTWRTLSSMPTARHGVQAAVCNGGIYIVDGGQNQGGGNLTTAHEVFFLGAPTSCTGTTASTLGASPASVSFGNVVVGQTDTRGVQLTNLGGAGAPNIVVDATTLTGTNANQFSDNFNDAANVTLAPGQSVTVLVDFEPTSQGAKSASLQVAHSGINNPVVILLDGSGTSTGGDTTPPAKPTGLGATAGNNQVTLGWTANGEPDLAGYRVYRSTSLPVATTGTPLNGATLLTTAGFLDTSAVNGTTYHYVVVAVDTSSNASAPSDPASATPQGTGATCPDDVPIFALPVHLEFNGGGGRCGDSGFSTVMPNAGTQTAPNLDLALISVGGGTLNITTTTGDAKKDSQQNALAVRVDATGAVEITTRLKTPLGILERFDSAGVWFGFSEFDYIKFVARLGDVEMVIEEAGAFGGSGKSAITPVNLGAAIADVTLVLRLTPGAGTAGKGKAEAFYSIDGGPAQAAGTLLTVPASFFAMGAYAGVIQTNTGNATSFVAHYDAFTVTGLGGTTTPPPTPTGLVATPGASQILLDWNDVATATGYHVYRGTSSSVAPVGTPLNGATPLTVSAFADTSAVSGTVYYYIVTALNSAGTSPPTAPVSAQGGGGTDTTPPAKPTGLGATAGNNQVTLGWTANGEPDLAGYRVYRSTSLPVATTGTPLNGATLLTTASFLDTSAVNGTTYHYVVVAVDASNNASAPSDPASATPAGSSAISFTTKLLMQGGTTAPQGTLAFNGFVKPTSLALGPDGRLYVGTQFGKIFVLTLDYANLTNPSVIGVSNVQVVNDIHLRPTRTCNIGGNLSNCQYLSGTPTGRQLTGIAIGPESTFDRIVLYVGHSDPRIGENNSTTALAIDTYSSELTRLTLQPNTSTGDPNDMLVTGDEDLVVGMPRSRENHSINGLAFGPDGWLYISLPGHTNFGQPSTFFSMLPEYYLSAAVVRLRMDALGSVALPLNVEGVDSAADMVPFAGLLELFATGYRNGYDLVWHSNGRLYLNDNAGNGGLGSTPSSAEGCNTPSINPTGVKDTLHIVTPGAYGGHPAPIRGECVLNDGTAYSPPLTPHSHYSPPILGYTNGASTNGIVEYTSNAFNGQLRGNLISATYAGNKNVRRVILNQSGDGVVGEINLGAFAGPLDVTTDASGIIYIGEHGPSHLTIMIPAQVSCPNPNLADDDADGYSDIDEAAHGTDPCSASSKPADFDGDFIGDLTDPDDDNDGLADVEDQLFFDPQNGAATPLPIQFEWNPGDDPLGGVAGTGFTGAQVATNGPRLDTSRISVGAAGGFMTILTSPGTAVGAANSQVNALQVGFDSTSPFRIWGRIVEPFNSTTPAAGHYGGIFFGPDQNNYLRLTIVGTAGGGQQIQLGFEQAGVFTASATAAVSGSIKLLDLYLVGDPATATLAAYFELEGTGQRILLGQAVVPGNWFSNNTSVANRSLAGLMASHGTAAPTAFVYDFFRLDRNVDFSVEEPSSLAATSTSGEASLSWSHVSVATGDFLNPRTSPGVAVTPWNRMNGRHLISGSGFTGLHVVVGTQYVVTAVDTSGGESSPSNEVSVTIQN